MNVDSKLFDYRPDLWHSRSMEPERCHHTINHVAEDGFLNGSWTTDSTAVGTRVLCESCGKFYGYLSKLHTPPVRRPVARDSSPGQAGTGSSSCSDLPEAVGQRRDVLPPPAATPEAANKRGSIDFAELRCQVSIRDVLELLEFSPVSRSGSQVRGPCPVHRSRNAKSRNFSVSLEKNTYQCFSKSCGSKGNQLDLHAAATGLPFYDAALSLCDKLGIQVPWKGASK